MGAYFTCRPGVPLPKVLQTGVSESEMKGIAVDITAVINKILGESQAKHGGPALLWHWPQHVFCLMAWLQV